MIPITRIERYLAQISQDDDANGIDDPVTRLEYYLAKISGESVTLPERPITRLEMYLAKIAGESNGIPDAPVTRVEMYLAAIAGESVQPPEPITRIEMYLAKWAEGGSGTITTVTGVSPLALVNALAKPIKSLTQTGKCVQNGTPTPDAPVDIVCNNGAIKWGASGTNLLDMAEENIRLRYYINDSGAETSNTQNFYNTKFIPAKPNTAYTLSVSEPVYYSSIMEYDSNKGFLQRTLDGSASEKHASTTITTRADTAYILIGSNPNRVTMNMDDATSIDWMLNEGSTALPYEPYTEGIITDGTPEVLSVGAQTASVQNLFAVGDYADTHDIISGAVNRKVGVKVLTGEETMNYANDTLLLTINDIIATGRGLNRLLCTHYRERTSGDYFVHHNYSNNYVYFHNVNITSLEDWRAFFANQYAAGTPVIVMYPLAETTTEQTTPQPLRTEAGDNTVSVSSNVDPVELSVEYMAGG